MSKYEILNLFPIPLLKFKFKYHNEYQFKNVEKSVNIPEGWVLPLNTSFPNMKENDPFITGNIQKYLLNDMKICIDEVFEELNLPKNFIFKDFWYNIYHNGQGQEHHDHLPTINSKGTYWSGIYYNKNSSPTEFIRPDRLYQTQLFNGYKDCKLDYCFYGGFRPNVEDGDIIMFPPYLSHFVPLSNLEEPNMRVTFSFNLQLED